MSGATFGASDWVLRKLGVGYEDTENRMGEVSPLEQNAFAQGLFKRINNNSLTGKNLLNPNYVGDSEAWLIENYPIIAGYLSSKLNQEVNQ